MTQLQALISSAKNSFFNQVEQRKDTLLAMKSLIDAAQYMREDLLNASNEVLDTLVKKGNYIQKYLVYCQEDPDLFTKMPLATECIKGSITAEHCVYHNLYERLENELEYAFNIWYMKNENGEDKGGEA